MNPWAGVIVVIAILMFIVAWKGTQDNVISAMLGRPYGDSNYYITQAQATPSVFTVPTSNPAITPILTVPFDPSKQTILQGGAI